MAAFLALNMANAIAMGTINKPHIAQRTWWWWWRSKVTAEDFGLWVGSTSFQPLTGTRTGLGNS
jgi:hypothetical protein